MKLENKLHARQTQGYDRQRMAVPVVKGGAGENEDVMGPEHGLNPAGKSCWVQRRDQPFVARLPALGP